jgi:hypothetical protein
MRGGDALRRSRGCRRLGNGRPPRFAASFAMRAVLRLSRRQWPALALGLLSGSRAVWAQEQQEYIGQATMLPDGTIHIELHIRLPPGGWADGAKDYKPGEQYYDEVLQHIGGLKPGENKLVRPWPDPPPAPPHPP